MKNFSKIFLHFKLEVNHLVLSQQQLPCLWFKAKDRPSQVIIYHDIMGSLPGSHYYKYCKSRPCGFIQYYGYYTKGGSSFVYFNPNWKTLPYFLSSKETAFSMKLMERFDAEIFIGQLSFKQCADLCNYLHLGEKDDSIV